MLLLRPRARHVVNAIIAAHVGGKPISVLEAGGGSRSRLQQSGRIAVAEITTIDIDADQLARNDYATEKILADLQGFRPSRTYDLVEVINVLEHVEDVGKALRNLAAACAEDGLLVIGSPYLRSFSGLVTRFTPHRFHVFHRKRILGEKNAGQPGHPPFPTVYHPMIDPRRMIAFLEPLGFSTELLLFHQSSVLRRLGQTYGVLMFPLTLLIGLVNALTPKAYDTRNGEFYLVLRRRPAPEPRVPGPASGAQNSES